MLALLAFLVVIQFFKIDKTNPESNPPMDFTVVEQAPDEIGQLLHSACYDCHSNDTEYPWYTNIQPIGWWVKAHINKARKELNYANWGEYTAKRQAHKFDEMVDEVKEGHMPLKSYTWMHPEAKLTEAQRQQLTTWFQEKMSGGE